MRNHVAVANSYLIVPFGLTFLCVAPSAKVVFRGGWTSHSYAQGWPVSGLISSTKWWSALFPKFGLRRL